MKKLWQTGSSTDAFIESYTVGEDPELDGRFLPYEVYGSIAHAAGLAKIGILSKKDFAALKKALKGLLSDSSFSVTREQEDIHTAVEQALTRKLGETGRRIHAGRSRNDQVQTNMRLYLKDSLLDIHALSCSAASSWLGFAEKNKATRIPGYTHLQRAMPTTIGHWAASHAEALIEGADTIRRAYEETDSSPLGSAAGFGAGLPLDRKMTASILGFSRVQRNSLRVQSARPRVEAAVLAGLALLARDLGTLAWDLSLFTTKEFGFLSLSPAFSTGSSLMPQKRNPDPVELTRAKAALFPGWLLQVFSVGQLPSGYHRDYQATKGSVCRAVDAMRGMLEAALRFPQELSVNKERCAAAVTGELLATERALEKVRGGMAFRDAYRAVADEARGGAFSAGAVEIRNLPEYSGAPGNPDFKAVAGDLKSRAAWSKKEAASLHRVWARLLA